jgi:hypothetical protein
MPRFASLATLVLTAALPALASANGEIEYRQAPGVDVEAEWGALEADLTKVSAGASYVFSGEILTTREDIGGAGPVTVVAIVVDESLRGSVSSGSVVEVEIPLRGPVSGDRPALPVPVRGYDIVVFLDEAGDVVEGGLFLLEGGFAWRPNRSGVLLSPRLQQDWEEIIDPIADYDVFTLDTIRSITAKRRTVSSTNRRRRR